MKRIFALIFVFMLTFCFLTACGEDPVVEVAEGFKIDNENLTLNRAVTNKTETLDLSNVKVTEDYEWKLFNDAECKKEAKKGEVALLVGENVFYLVIFDGDDEVVKYTVTVKRSTGIQIEESNGSVTGSIDMGELLE